MKSYINKIREKLGTEKFIHPAARIIIENEKSQILFIYRSDNGKIGIPAGGLEENETIEECIIREVKEEIGLQILDLDLIGLSTNPERETVIYPNGDIIQYFTCEFYSNSFSGKIKIDPSEVKSAQFLEFENFDHLPKNEISTFESLEYFRKNRRVRVY